MKKFTTIENNCCYLYTKYNNMNCTRKHIITGKTEKITHSEYQAAFKAALTRIKIYFEKR